MFTLYRVVYITILDAKIVMFPKSIILKTLIMRTPQSLMSFITVHYRALSTVRIIIMLLIYYIYHFIDLIILKKIFKMTSNCFDESLN